ncbi:hypothetical protein DC74_618 [Streptomyces noursei]|nr:hypothetical protein DC74_618 [Streptomyces noursei]
MRMAGAPVQVSRALPQVTPAPKTASRIRPPGGSSPRAAAPASAYGALAAPMLPTSSPTMTSRPGGMPIRSPRLRSSTGLGWWVMTASMSSSRRSLAARLSRTSRGKISTMKSRTARPSMWMWCRCAPSVAGLAGARLPPAGIRTWCAPVPSEPRRKSANPAPSCTGPSTAAAAPSANSTAVPRSVGSRNFEYASTPTTAAYRAPALPRSQSCATRAANSQPAQAALTSSATACRAPIRAWMRQAVDGPSSSGVEVAAISTSSWSTSMPAAATAARTAFAARSEAAWSGSATCRVCTPVRWAIHSAVTPAAAATSWLVRVSCGR